MANTTADKLAKLLSTRRAMKAAINGSGNTVGDVFADYPPAVSNGRAGIAAAITEKGVQTPADAPFDVLEANVRAIESAKPVEMITITSDLGPETVFMCYDGVHQDVSEVSVPAGSVVFCTNPAINFGELRFDGELHSAYAEVHTVMPTDYSTPAITFIPVTSGYIYTA